MRKILIIGAIAIIGVGVIFNLIKFHDNEEMNFSITPVIENKEINFSITSITENKEIKSEDGTTLISVKYSYPTIENKSNSKFISSINDEYKLNAEEFLNDAEESKEEAESLYKELEEVFRPYTRELDFDINMNNKGLISITNNNYYYNGGAHGSYVMQSRTFDFNNEIELTLDKVINNDAWNIKENVHELFEKKLQKDDFTFDEIWRDIFEEEVDNVNFYLTENAVVLYFNAEQIAPYALGVQKVEVPYDDKIFLIDISSDKKESAILVKSLTPTGFAGSSLNRIDLYSNGDIYWVQYDGEGLSDENIIKNALIATGAIDIQLLDTEEINVVGEDVEFLEEVGISWIHFNK